MLVFGLCMAAACRGPAEAPAGVPDAESANAAAQAWRVKHEDDYRRDWVSIAGAARPEAGHQHRWQRVHERHRAAVDHTAAARTIHA